MNDIYDYLKYNNYIKYENKKERSKNLKKKCDIIVKKLNDSDDSDDSSDESIDIITEYNNNEKLKLKRIDKLVENKNLITDENINILFRKYSKQLNDYYYIDNDVDKLKKGGYIKYINLNNDLNYGGILINIDNLNNLSKMKLILKNNYTNKIYKINFLNNYIFYKSHKTQNDNFRKLFFKLTNLK